MDGKPKEIKTLRSIVLAEACRLAHARVTCLQTHLLPFIQLGHSKCTSDQTRSLSCEQRLSMNTYQGEQIMIPSTVERVPLNTPDRINEAIRQQTEENVATYAARGRNAIEQRLRELDQEWDIERLLEANASIACLVGLALGASVDKKWFILPAAVAGFLLQHSIQGWCPPMPIMRSLGVRTASEIDHERYALKAIRGDFREVVGKDRRTVVGAQGAVEAARA